MPRQQTKLIDAKAQSYAALELAIWDNDLSMAELAEKLGTNRQSLERSINRKSFRLETMYELEKILNRKIVYSQFDSLTKTTEILEAKIETLQGVIREFAAKVPKDNRK